MKNQTLSLVLIVIVLTSFFWYAVNSPMSRSEAHSILNERGSIVYNKDMVYIYVPQYPCVLELEATAIIAETAEGVHLDVMYPSEE